MDQTVACIMPVLTIDRLNRELQIDYNLTVKIPYGFDG